jgi:hypothetical protein
MHQDFHRLYLIYPTINIFTTIYTLYYHEFSLGKVKSFGYERFFCSVWFLLKKNNETDFFLKKTKPVQTDKFWFGCLDKNQFGSVFSV